MEKLHIIAIPFTGVGLHGGYRGDEWYKHRIEIFKNYTLKSLANQTNKNFIVWCWFREEERSNPLTSSISAALGDAGISYVFSFNGLLYHDDKFTNYTLKTKLRNLTQMLMDGWHQGYKPLREVWKYTWENKNETLLKRTSKALSELKDKIGTGYELVYLTRIDSDDMFHKDAVGLLQHQDAVWKRAFTFQNGYMYNVVTGQLAEWIPPTNPPFHTIVFLGSVFLDAVRHIEYYGSFRSHEDIPKVFDAVCLDDNKYCVTAHGKDHISTSWDVPAPKRAYQKVKYYSHTTSGKNISTRWESRIAKKRNMMLGDEIIDTDKKREILAQFGVS